jgi:arabinose-5-phosphate isomerase
MTHKEQAISNADLILATARRTLEIETTALSQLASGLDDTSDFVRFVQDVAASSGRLIATGIGKSAIVAQKIVATLNSTGTAAVFLHAADAIHGDLGMIQPQDRVLCLSKSGETPEIRVLASLINGFGNPLAAMTANRASTLAQHADYILYTPIDQEADPHNLAPTASTTAQMALGDALATALLAVKGFSPNDFARFHPGGALGKQLYLRVRDLCVRHGRPAVGLMATLPEIILEMTKHRLGATAVLDADGNLAGLVTDGDLRRMLTGNPTALQQVEAQYIMSKSPKSIEANALAIDALALLRQHSITQLVVLEGQHYLGMVHLHDLVREGLV